MRFAGAASEVTFNMNLGRVVLAELNGFRAAVVSAYVEVLSDLVLFAAAMKSPLIEGIEMPLVAVDFDVTEKPSKLLAEVPYFELEFVMIETRFEAAPVGAVYTCV